MHSLLRSVDRVIFHSSASRLLKQTTVHILANVLVLIGWWESHEVLSRRVPYDLPLDLSLRSTNQSQQISYPYIQTTDPNQLWIVLNFRCSWSDESNYSGLTLLLDILGWTPGERSAAVPPALKFGILCSSNIFMRTLREKRKSFWK